MICNGCNTNHYKYITSFSQGQERVALVSFTLLSKCLTSKSAAKIKELSKISEGKAINHLHQIW